MPPIFERIKFCESGGTHYDKHGNVLIGITGDIGLYQINPIHLPDARERGIDIYTPAGNEAYARVLYKQRGTQPWYSSAHCWQGSS